MTINSDCAFIKFAKVGVDFQYFKLFLQTVEPYILEYKNVEYDKLTDKDKSIVLAKIIKSMYVNGRPVTEFFRTTIDKWNDKENFEKNQLFVEFMAREIFGCYDKSRDEYNSFYQTPYLFYIEKSNGTKDYFEPKKVSGLEMKLNKLKGKSSLEAEWYEYYLKLRNMEKHGTLSRV